MPLDTRTQYGPDVPYKVTQSLNEMAAAINQLEARVSSAVDVTKLRGDLQRLSARVDVLAKQVQGLLSA